MGVSREGGVAKLERKKKCYNVLEIIRFTDIPQIFTERLGSA